MNEHAINMKAQVDFFRIGAHESSRVVKKPVIAAVSHESEEEPPKAEKPSPAPAQPKPIAQPTFELDDEDWEEF